MPKTDGYKTREKLLEVSRGLFSDKGFEGTSIDAIAKAAGVNKALIYYHFKDKSDILASLLQEIVDDLDRHNSVDSKDLEPLQSKSMREKITGEIAYCQKWKRILSVMLMEALKVDGQKDFLFRVSQMVMEHQSKHDGETARLDPEDMERYRIHEFFTGFLPIVAFVVLQEQWSRYFGCDPQKAQENFIDAFLRTHLAYPGVAGDACKGTKQ